MSLYQQISMMANYFRTKVTTIPCPNGQTTILVTDSSSRIYIAFSSSTVMTGNLVFLFGSNVSVAGYNYNPGSAFIEFWIEKHKSLPMQKWSVLNQLASPISVTVIEMFYDLPETEHGETVNAETSERPDRLFRSNQRFAEDDRSKP